MEELQALLQHHRQGRRVSWPRGAEAAAVAVAVAVAVLPRLHPAEAVGGLAVGVAAPGAVHGRRRWWWRWRG